MNAPAQTMTAVLQTSYGGPEVLEVATRPRPEAGPDDVLIRVHAASLNFGDRMMLLGAPRLFRPAYGWPRPTKQVLGMDVAGEVVAMGVGVTDVAVGDRVFGDIEGGSCAEYVLGTPSRIARIPDGVSYQEAAALPVAGSTALTALRRTEVAAGDRVLVNGASGGVGTFVVQLAKARGAHVTAVCSPTKVQQARDLGADEVIDYTQSDYVSQQRSFDVVIDLVGNHTLRQRLATLRTGGRYGSSFGMGGSAWLGPLARILHVMLRSLFDARIRPVVETPNRADLEEVVEYVARGAVRPVIERVWPLHEAREAMAAMVGGHAKGKHVIEVPGS